MAIAEQVQTSLTHAFAFLVNLDVVGFVSPAFIPPAILIVYLYVRLSLSYVKCSRDLRRLESNARSPIFSNFGELEEHLSFSSLCHADTCASR